LLIEQGASPHARLIKLPWRHIIELTTYRDIRLAYFHLLRWGNPLQDPKKRLELIRILAKAVDDDDFFEFRPEASQETARCGVEKILRIPLLGFLVVVWSASSAIKPLD